jgi:hypothetical protein
MGWLEQLLRRAAPGDVPADPMAGSVMSPNYVPQTSRRQLGLGALRGLLDVTPVGIADAVQSGINNMQSPVGAALRAVTGKAASPGDVLLRKLGLLGSGSGYDAGRFALNAAFPAMGLLGNQAGGALPKGYARNQAGAIVWHGSPHKFDRFDASKIGTGEGAQAYGHGLYLAENPAVAAGYKETLSSRARDRLTIDGKAIDTDSMFGRAAEDIPRIGLKATLQKIEDNIRFNEKYAPDMAELYRGVKQQISSLDPSRVALKEGSLYKVDLPDDQIARMLDWDKPLGQQSAAVRGVADQFLNGPMSVMPTGYKVTKNGRGQYQPMAPGGVAMTSSAFDTPAQAEQYALEMLNEFRLNPGTKGNQIYGMFDRDPKLAADMLRRAGIPGIRYLDGGSRSAGSGSSNFVVFPGNEGLLNILERNGQPIR